MLLRAAALRLVGRPPPRVTRPKLAAAPATFPRPSNQRVHFRTSGTVMPNVGQMPPAASSRAATSRAEELLLEFLREHEAPCPVCGYNLKALVRPVCPECGQELVLAVGAARLRLGWLFAALAPGFFSGIAAVFGLVPIVGMTVFGNGKLPPLITGVDLFGWCSGVFAIFVAA